MGGRKKTSRRNWPEGLYARTVKGREYYFYRGPHAPKDVHLGIDLLAARRAVSTINARRAQEPTQAVLRKLERTASTVGEHVAWFKGRLDQKRNKKGQPLSDQTLYEYKRILDDIVTRLGASKAVSDVDRAALAGILEEIPGWTSNRYRQIMRDLFRHAIARGLRNDNPAELTLPKDTVVQRQRLPWEAFQAIRGAAEPWMQRTLDLALWSLQREGDLVLLRADEHWKDGHLRLAQSKVKRHGSGRLAIKPGPHLLSAILACLNSPEREPPPTTKLRASDTGGRDTSGWGRCPYLVHRIPRRHFTAEWKRHPMQVSADVLSREFGRLRDELGLFDSIPATQRPSFHEIRSLGADRYREVHKWAEDQVQALLGHTSSKMTREYLDRHGERWDEVSAG